MPRNRKYKKQRRTRIIFNHKQIRDDMSIEEILDLIFSEDTKSQEVALFIWEKLKAEEDRKLDASEFSELSEESKYTKATFYDVANQMVALGILEYNQVERTWKLHPNAFIDALKRLRKRLVDIWTEK